MNKNLQIVVLLTAIISLIIYTLVQTQPSQPTEGIKIGTGDDMSGFVMDYLRRNPDQFPDLNIQIYKIHDC